MYRRLKYLLVSIIPLLLKMVKTQDWKETPRDYYKKKYIYIYIVKAFVVVVVFCTIDVICNAIKISKMCG